jgi:hypothetical protein
MSTSPPTREGSRKIRVKDRRAAAGAKAANGPLWQLKGLLGRPLGLERRGNQLHVVLVDRRRVAPADPVPPLSQLRAELRARLLVQEHGDAVHVMRHLALVHDELGRRGWPSVAALPGQVLGKALVQAEMLATEEPSSSLQAIIDQLRSLQAEAARRDERAQKAAQLETRPEVEVSEATHEEYEELERSWVGTMPSGLRLAIRDE